MIGAGVKPLLQRALASKGLQFPPDEIDRLFGEYARAGDARRGRRR